MVCTCKRVHVSQLSEGDVQRTETQSDFMMIWISREANRKSVWSSIQSDRAGVEHATTVIAGGDFELHFTL